MQTELAPFAAANRGRAGYDTVMTGALDSMKLHDRVKRESKATFFARRVPNPLLPLRTTEMSPSRTLSAHVLHEALRSSEPKPCEKPRSFRPDLERLEDRSVPATLSPNTVLDNGSPLSLRG